MMDKNKIKKCTEYLSKNCNEFIARIWIFMIDTNWKWFLETGTSEVPSQEKIKEVFLALLNNFNDETYTDIESAGFHILINEDCIECYFGHNREISLKSTSCPDLDFIDYLCEENIILNKDIIIELYNKWKNSIE